MKVFQIIHRQLAEHCPEVHATRLKALLTCVESLVVGQKLTVTGLGRHSARAIAPKHAIKQADRLVGNRHLYEEREMFYRAIIGEVLGCHKRPTILIDWSDCPDNRDFVMLRASSPVGGRSLTLFEEVHPLKRLGNQKVQHQFLQQLAALLPLEATPIIITDAGFLVPWFRAVRSLGWDFVGRIRQSMMVSQDNGERWCKGTTLPATSRPRCLGDVLIAKANAYRGHLYTLKKSSRGRTQLTRRGLRSRSEHARKYRAHAAKPWLLFTSLGEQSPKQIIALYRTRMQIEEGFRDLKSRRTGFALTFNRCRSVKRMSNLLLVALIATWVACLVGHFAEHERQQYRFQANTVRHKRVLSWFFLGIAALNQRNSPIQSIPWETIKQMIHGHLNAHTIFAT